MSINVRPATPFHVFEAFIADAGHQLLFSFLLLGRQFFARRRDGPLFRGRPLKDAGAGAGHGHACFVLSLTVGSLSRDASASTPLDRSWVRPTRARTVLLWRLAACQGPAPPIKDGQLLTPRTMSHAAETPARDSRDAYCPVRTDRSWISGARKTLERSQSSQIAGRFRLPRSLHKPRQTKQQCTNNHGRV